MMNKTLHRKQQESHSIPINLHILHTSCKLKLSSICANVLRRLETFKTNLVTTSYKLMILSDTIIDTSETQGK
jgi:hypothetical protein